MTVSTTIVPLMVGLTIVICDEEEKGNLRHYLNYLNDKKINIIKMTPSYFKVLLLEIKNNSIQLPHLDSIVLGGESLVSADCVAWLSLNPDHVLLNEYGPTETTVAVSHYKVTKQNCSSLELNVPIGKPDANTSFYILGPDNTPVAEGEVGELFIGGSCLARGYLNKPELTNTKFIQNPFSKNSNDRLYKTGDLCRLLSDGNYEFLGRIDDQVKIRGFRIEPGEIEQHLAAHPAIEEARVIARDEQQNEKRLVAYYVLKNENTSLSVSDIQTYLKAHVPDYMIPMAFVRLSSFPLTANGKLNKSAPPRTPLYK